MANFTTEERIIKAKIDLNYSNPFFSYILMNMTINEVKKSSLIGTMGINKYGDLYWHKTFVDSITQKELEGVLAHEVGHIITDTFSRMGTRDKKLWNMATDIIINFMLIKENFVLPKTFKVGDMRKKKEEGKPLLPDINGKIELTGKKGKFTINVKNKTADMVYDILVKNAEKINGCGICNGKCDECNGEYDGQMDSHIPCDKDDEGNSTGKETSETSAGENAEEWKKKLCEAYTHAKMRGTISADIERIIEGILYPKINWKHKLYSFITNDIPIDFTMRFPSKKYYATGFYSPSVVRENLNIIIGCDASGSISYGNAETEGHQFLSEVLGIVTSFTQVKSRLIIWDAEEIHKGNDVVITNNNKMEILTRSFKAGGGTELSCFTRHIKKNNYQSNIYIIMTDGHIEEKPILPKGKILFVLSKDGNDQIVKKYGEVCRL